MSICGALSIGPFHGGATLFVRGGQCSSAPAHQCALPNGHTGPHAKRTTMRLSKNVAMRTTYTWNDKNSLTAQVEIVAQPSRDSELCSTETY